MQRFYLPPDHCRGSAMFLEGREAHHGLHVLRLRRGERITVLDGQGHEYLCEVQAVARSGIHLSLVQKTFIPRLDYQVTLVQGIPKAKIIEDIIEKATELGVARVVALLSERVVTRLDPEERQQKQLKWTTVAIEAMKQSGNPWLPRIEAPMTPEEFLQQREQFDLQLIGSLQPDAGHPRTWFDEYRSRRQHNPEKICVWVGPEGDFSPAEMEAIKAAGALPITLGRLVLRSETAAIYCLSVINHELQAG